MGLRMCARRHERVAPGVRGSCVRRTPRSAGGPSAFGCNLQEDNRSGNDHARREAVAKGAYVPYVPNYSCDGVKMPTSAVIEDLGKIEPTSPDACERTNCLQHAGGFRLSFIFESHRCWVNFLCVCV